MLNSDERAILNAWRDFQTARKMLESDSYHFDEGDELEVIRQLYDHAKDTFKHEVTNAVINQQYKQADIIDAKRLRDAHAKIARMQVDQQRQACVRASRSYSAPNMCIVYDHCTLEGGYIVWPDGERWPTKISVR